MKIEERLEELNLTLPAAPSPMANYVTCRRVGKLLFSPVLVPLRTVSLWCSARWAVS